MANYQNVALLFFDLPMQTKKQQRFYRKFKKQILANGYQCLQKSVYVKLLRNSNSFVSEWKSFQAVTEKGANIMLLPLSLESFKRLKSVCGEEFDFSLFADKILLL